MFFDSWTGIARVVIVGTLAYFFLVVMLRVTGKRALSKMNAFDLVVTVALGSTLATVLLSKDVALAEGCAAFMLLVFLQYGITWASVRSEWVRGLAKAEPRLLLHDGSFLGTAMQQERVTRAEVQAAIRASGIGSSADVAAVVIETDGSFTVIPRAKAGDRSALDGTRREAGR